MNAPAFLRLTRISLAPSLLADVLAGTAWSGVFLAENFVVAGLASLGLFVGGMALNARVDYEEDCRTRPDRPLPKGEVSRAQATALALFGLGMGPALGFLVSPSLGGWTLAMAGAIALYHGPIRRSVLAGPLLLGAIRGSNLFLGAVAGVGLSAALDSVLWAALVYAAYVTGASFVAHEEDRKPRKSIVAAGVTLAVAASALPVGFALGFGAPVWRIVALVAIVAFHWSPFLVAGIRHRRLPRFPHLAAFAGFLLGRMALLTTALTLASGAWQAALAALGAFGAVRLLVRWIPPT